MYTVVPWFDYLQNSNAVANEAYISATVSPEQFLILT